MNDLDEEFAELLKREEEFPPELPDMKSLYTDFYNEMTGLTRNLVCASCGCIEHHLRNFEILSVCDASLRHLTVDPSLVPFNFTSGIAELDNLHIMIDPLGVVSSPSQAPSSVLICRACQTSLQKGIQPSQSLANYRWVGQVPPQLQNLTWIEELLIARAHLTGRIVRLQNRNANSYFSLKGHVILLPQDTTELLNILPLPSSSLPDIVRVVWVGRPVRNMDVLRDHFSVRTRKVYDALIWLVENNEDYKDVAIDHSQFERWPPIWVAQELLDVVGGLEDGSEEDNARVGVATEDVDNPELEGDLPLTTSGIVDIEGVSQPAQLKALQHISLWKDDKMINVLTGNNILNEETLPSYFTSAFPTIFPWGTGKHLDNRRTGESRLDLKRWMQLLLKNSSRYELPCIELTCSRRFQRHRGFVILCYDILRRRHSLSKTNLITSKDTWETTDIGHIVPLTQVNRRLRYMLTEDNGYWLLLLHSRLSVKLTGKNRNTAFAEFVKRLPTLQCAECHRMELPWRPFIDPFWNRFLCDTCRFDDKYRVVTSYTAKHNYFLNEDDLLFLRTFSRKTTSTPMQLTHGCFLVSTFDGNRTGNSDDWE